MRKAILIFLMTALLAGGASAQTKKKRVADKKFWFAAAVMIAASVVDAESTAYWMRVCPTCTERNSWLYGKRPTRKRMYPIMLAVTGAEIYAMWWVKKDDNKQGTKAWLVIPVVHTGAHGAAAWNNWANAKPKEPVCPALGEGCK